MILFLLGMLSGVVLLIAVAAIESWVANRDRKMRR